MVQKTQAKRVLGYKVSDPFIGPRRPKGPCPKTRRALSMETFRVGRHRFSRKKQTFDASMISSYKKDASRLSKRDFELAVISKLFPTTSGKNQPITKTSEGSFGVVYKVRVTRQFQKDLRLAKSKGFNVLHMKTPPLGSWVACKVEFDIQADVRSGQPWTKAEYIKSMNATLKALETRGTRQTRKYIQRVTQESMVHSTLAAFKGPHGLRGSSSFTKFFMSWMDPTYGIHVSVSEFIRGVTLRKYKSVFNTAPLAIIKKFERAIQTLWYAGFAHVDTHLDNVMVTEHPRRVILLDFGRSHLLPVRIHESIKAGIDRGDHMETIWKSSGLRRWMDVTARKYGFYYPNIRGLRQFVRGSIFM